MIKMETEIMNVKEIPEQKESIKITKNTKGFSWEFKIFIENKNELEALDKCEAINNELKRRFGALDQE